MKKTIRLFMAVAFALCLVLSFAVCGDEGGQEPIVTMSLNTTAHKLQLGPGAAANQKTVILKATVKEDGTAKTDAVIEWSSSDETKATVNAGVVTAVAVGTATITATYGELTDTCAITVENLEKLTVEKTEAAIFVDMIGDATFQIEAEVTGGGIITYKSSNEAVAEVDANGLVTGLTTGTATITVSSPGAVDVTCAITVTNLIEPYNFGSGNFAAVRGDQGKWYWFTQTANIGTYVKLNQANFNPVSSTLKIDFDRVVNGWEEGYVGAEEYAFRIQPLLTENKTENIGIEYTFTATFVSDRTGKIAIYDRDFGKYIPDHEGRLVADGGQSVTLAEAAAAKEVNLEVQDLVKWYNVTAGEEVQIEFRGKINGSDGSLVVRPYMYSDFNAVYPNAEGESLGEMHDDPFYVMLQNMTFTVGGVEVDYRTGKVVTQG